MRHSLSITLAAFTCFSLQACGSVEAGDDIDSTAGPQALEVEFSSPRPQQQELTFALSEGLNTRARMLTDLPHFRSSLAIECFNVTLKPNTKLDCTLSEPGRGGKKYEDFTVRVESVKSTTYSLSLDAPSYWQQVTENLS